MATTRKANTTYRTAGFSPQGLDDIKINGASISAEYKNAIINAFLQRTMMGVSTFTLQLADPYRYLIKSVVKDGAILTVDGLSYTLVQFMKASDQLQMVFESTTVHRLRNQYNQNGQVKTTTGTGVTQFMASLCNPLGIPLVAPDYQAIWTSLAKKPIVKVQLGRGTQADPYESSWVCMSRIASQVGWRLWESAGTVYFGPDEYWLGNLTAGVPPINKVMNKIHGNLPILKEFTPTIQLIDFDWDIGKPYGQASVTCMMDNFNYQIGEVVKVEELGPANGYWLVSGMQRDLFLPQATLSLQVAMPFSTLFEPTSLPLKGFPLTPNADLLK